VGRTVRAIRRGEAAQVPAKALRYLHRRNKPIAPRSIAVSGPDDKLHAALAAISAASAVAPPRGRPRTDDLSEGLQAFTRAEPYIREGILTFIRETAASLPAEARVLDIGAGEAPYRELFAHVSYTTTDWEHSVHPGAARADTIAPADDLPFADESFDVAIMTEVLEHVASPGEVLAEAHRVLRPGGRLYLTVPFVWPLHEMPNDHYRYTPSSLIRILGLGGFAKSVVKPHGDYFLTLAQLLWDAPGLIGLSNDGLNDRRKALGESVQELSLTLARLSRLDADPILPLGFTAVARKGG